MTAEAMLGGPPLVTDCRRTVLYLTHHVPWPALSGGTVREYQLLARLAPRFDIDLVAVEKRGRAPAEQDNPLDLSSVTVFTDQSAGTARRQRHSEALRRRLAAGWGGCPDIVHVEGGYLAHLLPAELLRRACLVEHNVESAVLRHRHRSRGTASCCE